MLILPKEMFAMYCSSEGRVGIKYLQPNLVIVNSGGRFKFRFMHFCLVKLKGASSDKLTPVCGHTGQWSTLVQLWVCRLLNKFPTGSHPAPLTAQRPDRINLPLRNRLIRGGQILTAPDKDPQIGLWKPDNK